MTRQSPVLDVQADPVAVAAHVSARVLRTVESTLRARSGVLHIGLTGGSMGAAVLRAVAGSPDRKQVDWTRLHFWWSDERYLPSGDPDRNETQSRIALLDELDLDPRQIHAMPARGEYADIASAAHAYASELATYSSKDQAWPHFDILLLGVGPDGHIASLFPGHNTLSASDDVVLTETDSPKPPAERLTLTLPVINSAERIWCVLTGADKAAALRLALTGADTAEIPAAGLHARQETVFFADEAAATNASA